VEVVLLELECKPVPQYVREVRKDKKRRNGAEGRHGDNGAHRKIESSPAAVAEHGDAFRGVWELPRGGRSGRGEGGL
jgi:hypothetical protein